MTTTTTMMMIMMVNINAYPSLGHLITTSAAAVNKVLAAVEEKPRDALHRETLCITVNIFLFRTW